jgi:hypothetical protein
VIQHGHRRRHHRRDRHDDRSRDSFTPTQPTGPHTTNWDKPTPRNRHSPRGQHTTNPIPPHSPSQMPFGMSPTPRATSPIPFGTAGRATPR